MFASWKGVFLVPSILFDSWPGGVMAGSWPGGVMAGRGHGDFLEGAEGGGYDCGDRRMGPAPRVD